MKVRTAKAIAKGQTITKIVVLNEYAVTEKSEAIPTTWYERKFSEYDDGEPNGWFWFEEGDLNEEPMVLNEIIRNNDVMEIWTGEVKVYQNGCRTMGEIWPRED